MSNNCFQFWKTINSCLWRELLSAHRWTVSLVQARGPWNEQAWGIAVTSTSPQASSKVRLVPRIKENWLKSFFNSWKGDRTDRRISAGYDPALQRDRVQYPWYDHETCNGADGLAPPHFRSSESTHHRSKKARYATTTQQRSRTPTRRKKTQATHLWRERPEHYVRARNSPSRPWSTDEGDNGSDLHKGSPNQVPTSLPPFYEGRKNLVKSTGDLREGESFAAQDVVGGRWEGVGVGLSINVRLTSHRVWLDN